MLNRKLRRATSAAMQPKLLEFFNATHDALAHALRASGPLSSASKGAERESDVGEVLSAMLPPTVRLETGDIIDGKGNATGQLDHIVVHHTGPMVRRRPSGRGFVLAEGVVAVVEVKSNLSKQWPEVVATWEKLQRVLVDGRCIPFFVIALEGWIKAQSVADHLAELIRPIPKPHRNTTLLVTLEPPRVGDIQDESSCVGIESEHEKRGASIAAVWKTISIHGRSLLYREIPWADYLGF